MRRRLALFVAALTLTLMMSSACDGGVTGDDAGNGGAGNSGTGSSGTSKPESSTGESSTGPISQTCQPPDMENCYGYEDMRSYLDHIIPGIEQFFDTTYVDKIIASP